MSYQLSPVRRAERGQNPSVASDTGKGGWREGRGVAKDKEKHQKKYWREGQPRDEETWTVQPRRQGSDGGKMKGEK